MHLIFHSFCKLSIHIIKNNFPIFYQILFIIKILLKFSTLARDLISNKKEKKLESRILLHTISNLKNN